MVSPREPSEADPLRVLLIGRFDSYKRLDWLLHALLVFNRRGLWMSLVMDGGVLFLSS